MECPHCGSQMQYSNMVIDTFPETLHLCCEDCGLVLDVCEGRKSVCCCWNSKTLSANQIESVNQKLRKESEAGGADH